jgi:hypothetical protein
MSNEVCSCYVAGLSRVGGDHAEICLLGAAEERAERAEHWERTAPALLAALEAVKSIIDADSNHYCYFCGGVRTHAKRCIWCVAESAIDAAKGDSPHGAIGTNE